MSSDQTRLGSLSGIYMLLFDTWRKFLNLIQAVFVGLWLGVLPRKTLHEIDEREYRRRDMYRGEEWNRRGLFEWERDAIASHFPKRGRLCVVGAGGGREVLALAQMGYEVAGFECNRALVETADRLLREDGKNASVRWLAPDAAPRDSGRFDGAIVGWGAYMLMIGRDHRIRYLRELGKSMSPGGPVLLSFWTRKETERRLRWIYGVASTIRRVLGREPVEPGDDLVPHFLHRFTPDEVEREINAGGFAVRQLEEWVPDSFDSGFAVGIRHGGEEPHSRGGA